MTSSIDAWKEHYALDHVRFPADIDELAVICCESDTRTVTHIGIELENCIFNNSTLQQLRRRVALGAVTRVQVRYNTGRMDRIWVQDPITLQRFEVLNQDPNTKDLSAKQVAALESIRRKSNSMGTVITRAQARKRIEQIYRPMLQAKTMLERRRAFKILGLISAESEPEIPKKGTTKARAKPRNTRNDPVANSQKPSEVKGATPTSSQDTSPPKFKVVRQGSTPGGPKTNAEGNANADKD